jgi:hypothetical protein
MNVKRNICHAVTAGLLSVGMAFAAVPAYAAPGGNITFETTDNASATYDGYLVFKANVATDYKATDIEWASDGMKTAVLAYLDSDSSAAGYKQWLQTSHHISAAYDATNTAMKAAHDLAQNAADYISSRIAADTADANANTTPKTTLGTSFASGLARYLVSQGVAKTFDGQSTYTGGEQGYYLIVTHNDTIGTGEAGTAPIWLPLGAADETVTAKDSVPTVSKQVQDDLGTWGTAADAHKGQALSFKLTGTVADNVNAYEQYYYKMTDTMTNLAMTPEQVNAVTVTVNGVDKTAAIKTADGGSISYDSGVLTVTIPNLLTLGSTITKDTQVVVTYSAQLTGDSIVQGGDGNANNVVLEYSSNPLVYTEHDSTTGSTAKTYAYTLELTKVDEDTREKLNGAKFTMRVKDDASASLNDASSKGKYVQADGTLGTEPYQFTTVDGKFSVANLDEGVYVLHETQAPPAHKSLAADVEITIDGTFTGNALTEVASTVTGGDGGFVSPADTEAKSGIIAATASNGKIEVRISDKNETYLPGTGMTTSAAGMILGAGLVTAGIIGAVRARKKEA